MRDNILSTIRAILIGLFLGVFFNTFVIGVGVVPTPSMEPTIMVGDKIIISKLSSLLGVDRGDVIVFKDDKTDKLIGKRVIGLGGDTIEIKSGDVYVNNELYVEKYVVYWDKVSMEKIIVPVGELFLLGDNRLNSQDSRFWENKTVPESKVVGVIKFTGKSLHTLKRVQ